MNTDRYTPVVFVSSTCYDLKQVREDLKDFFETYSYYPQLQSKCINPDNKMITIAHIDSIVWIHQMIKRTTNTTGNND